MINRMPGPHYVGAIVYRFFSLNIADVPVPVPVCVPVPE
jgi:hypothetical protein